MVNKDVKKMGDEELKEEHRRLGKKLEILREDRRTYENDSILGQNSPERGEREQINEIDKEMDEIRKQQKKIYNEFMRRRNARRNK